MTQPPSTYTITVHWRTSKHTDLDEPVTDTASDWATARTMGRKLTTLRAAVAVVIRDPDGELIANWDAYSNLWREPRPRPTIDTAAVDRARILAADYRAHPTPARAHNAAQILWTVLGTLDAVVARTFAITDENTRLAAASPLGKAAPRTRPGLPTIDADDERQHPAWPHIDDQAETAPDCVHHRRRYQRTRCADQTCRRCWLGGPHNWPSRIAAAAKLADQLDMPPIAELPDDAANHWTTVDNAQTGQLCDIATAQGFTPADKPTCEQIADLVAKHLPRIPAPLCFADGPVLGTNTLTCFLAQGHEGAHSTNAFPNPRTWPRLATGGTIDTTTARIGEN